jgi:hypothetical protein
MNFFCRLRPAIAAVAALLLAASCLGAGAEITLKQDGSGAMNLEYRLSRAAESLGKQDGNDNWPLLPLGRADFERTIRRIDGLSLRSYSARPEGKDLVYRARIGFSSPAALLRFLDPSGKSAFTPGEDRNRLSLVIPRGGQISPELRDLFRELSEGYALELRFSLPREAELSLRPSLPAGAEIQGRGKKVFFKAPLSGILEGSGDLIIDLVW